MTADHTASKMALAKIVAGLDGVTPGPWAYECHGRDGTYGVGLLLNDADEPQRGKQETGAMLVAEPVAAELQKEADAAHIARIDPDTVRAIAAYVCDLEAALQPFARAADVKLCGEWRDDQFFHRTDVGSYLTFGDLRRARAALGGDNG